jgi:prolyl-tRNA editing enzyme YbaK/EbsC (Cys-tRNA(Pro) deacylase)
MKTNAARLLDSLDINYELRTYEVDPDDLAAESVAARVGLPPEQVFKTLLAAVTAMVRASLWFPATTSWTTRNWRHLAETER